jgi:hypothetical protein
VVRLHRNAKLPQIVAALRPASRFTRRLNGGEQQTHQDADDSDDHEQLDERETTSPLDLRKSQC